MATPENLHKNIPNAQLHDPKDFSTAGVGTALRKGMDSNLEWAVPYWQDSVLDRVDMALTPPSENDGDRYIIINLTSTVVHADWDGASENDIVEFDLDASAWVSVTPFFDMTARSQADLNQYYFDGTTWNDVIGSSGDVSQSGTSSDNQIAVFTADKTIEGNSDFTFDSTLNTFNINQFGTGSLNVSLGIAKMQMDSNPSTWQSYTHDSTTNTSLLELIRSRGTAASPSAVQSGDALGRANFKGYNTSSYIVGGLMEFNATETWSGSAQGTEFKVQTILTGATSLADRIVVDGSGDITLGNYKFDGDQTVGAGQDDYVLTYDNATGLISLEAAAGGGLNDIVDDATPQLGGSLDVNGNKIVSVSNGNIDIEPNGTGNVLLGNFTFDADQTVGAGQDDYVLTYDHGTGLISLEAAAGGGSSEWDDLSNGAIGFNGTAAGAKKYIEINDGTAFNPAGGMTVGSIVVGDLHTSTNLVRRTMIFGYSNSMATVGTSTGEVVFGTTNTIEGGSYNLITGYLNTMKSGKNYSAMFGYNNTMNGSESFIAGNANTVNADYQACLGWNQKLQSGVNYQIAIGMTQQITSNHNNRGIFFSMGSSRPNISMVNADSTNAMNMAMGSYNSGRTTDGAGLTGTGGGVFYWMNAQTVAPTVDLPNAAGIYGKDRTAGKSGLIIKAEDGSEHFFSDFSAIGGDETDANANKTLTIVGTGTGSGTSSLLCVDSGGTANFEVRDDGVIIMASLPTSSAGLPTGALWNNSGVLNIV